MNYDLLTNIFEQLSNSKHSQFGIVAIIRAILFVVNKEIWKTFLKFRLMVLKRDAIKEREITADSELNFIDQSVGLICEEFTKTCENISKIFHVGLSKHVFTTQTTHISTFNMGNTTNKIQREEQRKTPATGSNVKNTSDSASTHLDRERGKG